jgi:serine protease AprX
MAKPDLSQPEKDQPEMIRPFKLLTGVALTATLFVPLASVPAQADTTSTTVVKGHSDNSFFADDAAVHGRAAVDDPGSLFGTDRMINADKLWSKGITGAGVDVAVLDSGVSPVAGLNAPGKIVYGPDLSFDGQPPSLQYLDGYGHGTHMAGIIASDDVGGANPLTASSDAAEGVAPDARIVSVKVASADGSTDVSQVIAGIDWIVQHQHDNGMNIRVLNLSFGTSGSQSYQLDPLTYAVENAWRHGIVVVVAAGNDGVTAPLNDPGYDPYVITVGASDHMGTVGLGDDQVASFSSRGSWDRRPDLVAPGRSIASLRDPSSYIDTNFPTARVGDRFFRGSGSSQATAVTSGAAALLLQARPWLTPDQVKQLLVKGAMNLAPDGIDLDKGLARLDVAVSNNMNPQSPPQSMPPATGLGSIDAARGTTIQLFDNGVELNGEQDVMGMPWNASQWAAATANGTAWNGGWWNGSQWTGSTWADGAWASGAWSGRSWTGRSWSGRSWTGRSWTDAGWLGHSWTGRSWT